MRKTTRPRLPASRPALSALGARGAAGALVAASLAAAAGCSSAPSTGKYVGAPAERPVVTASHGYDLYETLKSRKQWAGLAISRTGRTFVTYPRWSDDVPVSVGEITKEGYQRPFPDADWNDWAPGFDAASHFVCAQAAWVDPADDLWIVDPASPKFAGVVPGAAKLVRISLTTNRVLRTYLFDASIAPPGSYLNDVRVDLKRGVAWLTDSGAGALVSVDLASGRARRLLAGRTPVMSEGIDVVIDGAPWRSGGRRPEVHADGIALDPTGEWLYWHALTGRTLWRARTRDLLDETIGEDERERRAERLLETGPADGMEFGSDGLLYVTSLEGHGIRRLEADGTLTWAVQDPRLIWPDSIAVGGDGALYVTTSQINAGPAPKDPYYVYRLRPDT